MIRKPWNPLRAASAVAIILAASLGFQTAAQAVPTRVAEPPKLTATAVPSFTDVGPGTQFYTEIGWLASEGISTGYPDGSFRPDDVCPRWAALLFLHRAVSSAGKL